MLLLTPLNHTQGSEGAGTRRESGHGESPIAREEKQEEEEEAFPSSLLSTVLLDHIAMGGPMECSSEHVLYVNTFYMRTRSTGTAIINTQTNV